MVKLEPFLMRPLWAKFGKICQWTKNIKGTVVYRWGRQIFSKSPKENKNSWNMSTACLFKKIDVRFHWKVHEERTVVVACYTWRAKSSPTPSSSTSHSWLEARVSLVSIKTFWACCWKLRYEIENRENAGRTTIRSGCVVTFWMKNKTIYHCLQKRFISVKTRI